MTVKELRVAVCKIPFELDDAPVILQKDPEGNGYHEMQGLDADAYWDEESEEAGILEDLGLEEDEDNPYPKCVVLFP